MKLKTPAVHVGARSAPSVSCCDIITCLLCEVFLH